jgi:hypothetical protein
MPLPVQIRKLRKLGYTIYSAELILTGILRQALDIASFQL